MSKTSLHISAQGPCISTIPEKNTASKKQFHEVVNCNAVSNYLLSSYLPPIVRWLPKYNRHDCLQDFVASLTITTLMIPQSIAYAMISGVDAEMGLFTGIFPCIIYGIFSASSVVSPGPNAPTSILIASSVAALTTADTFTDEYMRITVALTFLSGVVLLILSLLRMSFIARLISWPVLTGFMVASGVQIIVTQLKDFFRLSPKPASGVFPTLIESFKAAKTAHWPTIVMAVVCYILFTYGKEFTMFGRKLPALFPLPLVVMAVAIGISYGVDLESRGFRIIGNIPSDLPKASIPDFSMSEIGQFATQAVILGVMNYMQTLSMIRALGKKCGEVAKPDTELFALGLANFVSSFFKCHPVCGGLSRTAVQANVGVKTPMTNIFVGLLTLVSVLILTPLFRYLPNAVLAAMITSASLGLVKNKDVFRMWKARNYCDLFQFVATFAFIIGLGIDKGIIAGLVSSLVLGNLRFLTSSVIELRSIPGTRFWLPVNRTKEFPRLPAARVLSTKGELNYMTTKALVSEIDKATDEMSNNVQNIQEALLHAIQVTAYPFSNNPLVVSQHFDLDANKSDIHKGILQAWALEGYDVYRDGQHGSAYFSHTIPKSCLLQIDTDIALKSWYLQVLYPLLDEVRKRVDSLPEEVQLQLKSFLFYVIQYHAAKSNAADQTAEHEASVHADSFSMYYLCHAFLFGRLPASNQDWISTPTASTDAKLNSILPILHGQVDHTVHGGRLPTTLSSRRHYSMEDVSAVFDAVLQGTHHRHLTGTTDPLLSSPSPSNSPQTRSTTQSSNNSNPQTPQDHQEAPPVRMDVDDELDGVSIVLGTPTPPRVRPSLSHRVLKALDLDRPIVPETRTLYSLALNSPKPSTDSSAVLSDSINFSSKGDSAEQSCPSNFVPLLQQYNGDAQSSRLHGMSSLKPMSKNWKNDLLLEQKQLLALYRALPSQNQRTNSTVCELPDHEKLVHSVEQYLSDNQSWLSPFASKMGSASRNLRAETELNHAVCDTDPDQILRCRPMIDSSHRDSDTMHDSATRGDLSPRAESIFSSPRSMDFGPTLRLSVAQSSHLSVPSLREHHSLSSPRSGHGNGLTRWVTRIDEDSNVVSSSRDVVWNHVFDVYNAIMQSTSSVIPPILGCILQTLVMMQFVSSKDQVIAVDLSSVSSIDGSACMELLDVLAPVKMGVDDKKPPAPLENNKLTALIDLWKTSNGRVSQADVSQNDGISPKWAQDAVHYAPNSRKARSYSHDDTSGISPKRSPVQESLSTSNRAMRSHTHSKSETYGMGNLGVSYSQSGPGVSASIGRTNAIVRSLQLLFWRNQPQFKLYLTGLSSNCRDNLFHYRVESGLVAPSNLSNQTTSVLNANEDPQRSPESFPETRNARNSSESGVNSIHVEMVNTTSSPTVRTSSDYQDTSDRVVSVSDVADANDASSIDNPTSSKWKFWKKAAMKEKAKSIPSFEETRSPLWHRFAYHPDALYSMVCVESALVHADMHRAPHDWLQEVPKLILGSCNDSSNE